MVLDGGDGGFRNDSGKGLGLMSHQQHTLKCSVLQFTFPLSPLVSTPASPCHFPLHHHVTLSPCHLDASITLTPHCYSTTGPLSIFLVM